MLAISLNFIALFVGGFDRKGMRVRLGGDEE